MGVESFTPRVGAATQDSKVGRSSDGQGRPSITWGQGIPIRPSKNLPQPSDPSSRPSATLPISPASVSDAISRLQQEKTRPQKNSDKQKAEQRDSTIADLRSLLDRRRRELDGLEQSMANTQDEWTRLQLHATEISTSLVAV